MTLADASLVSDAFRVETRDNVAIITFDLPDKPVNTISRTVGDELIALLDHIERATLVHAAVLLSGKRDSFIAGADIEQFRVLHTARDAERLSRDGQMLMDRIERSRVPVIAAIHGACLGGGLEAALACAYRIATDHPSTALGLPEVQLGLIPGAGGTQRLPQRVGLRNALDMILTGKSVRAKKALSIGLVDELVHPAILLDVALDRARAFASGTSARPRRRRPHKAADLALERNPLGRRLVFRQAREQTLRKTRGHYPAPLAALTAVAAGYAEGRAKGLAVEAFSFGEMAMTDVSTQLVFLFFATSALKKDSGVDTPNVAPLPVHKLGVLGAGFMGAGIAAVAAMQHTAVRLKDAAPERVGKGLRAVYDVLRERLRKRRITRQQFADEFALVGGTTEYTGFGNADLVIEAVFEDLELKQRVLREAEAVIPSDAIYASNTSTIPITRIAEASRRPEQVLGMHFFSPVPKMPLLEVITTPRTSDVATVTAVAYGKTLGKHVIVVNDGPGFYTTRTLAAFMNEAGYLLDQGVSIEALDRALVEFGFPVGPVTLLDEVGIDVGAKVGHVLYEAFGERLTPAQSLERVAASGRLGRKGGKGFYRYDAHGKKGPVDETVYEILPTGAQRRVIPAEEMETRTVLAMVNEAARCLGEGVLRSARDGDLGAVFGIGFPPFRGGPFRYVDTLGVGAAARQLRELNAKFGARFEPAPLLARMAKTGERFYP
ncbi:MAG TPA: fatty acid oxidation complex subunit alpha FadJ [Gemmatimonadaceae bacterium]|nr:fatty acid oxidation complex subunit alpha FadJ [Gemmatimonadaceae bacterium]